MSLRFLVVCSFLNDVLKIVWLAIESLVGYSIYVDDPGAYLRQVDAYRTSVLDYQFPSISWCFLITSCHCTYSIIFDHHRYRTTLFLETFYLFPVLYAENCIISLRYPNPLPYSLPYHLPYTNVLLPYHPTCSRSPWPIGEGRMAIARRCEFAVSIWGWVSR